jgi:cytochrome c peroxidase
MKKLIFIIFCIINLFAYTPITPINPIMVNKSKARLGMKLFFDPIFSANKKVSCRNCHNPMRGWADKRKVSIGVYGKLGHLQSPTVLNAVYNIKQFWNGRANTLKDQIDGPINNPVEMGINPQIVERIINQSPYKERFAKVFYNKNYFTYDDFKKAIVEFEYMLTTPNCKFDKYLKHQTTLTKQELEGYELFKSIGCIKCHDGQNIGGNKFEKFGISNQDKCIDDRYTFTHNKADKCFYRVPTLRNIALSAPYFHNAQTYSLKKAIEIMALKETDTKLTPQEIDKIYSFLLTLTGDFPPLRELMKK